MKSIIHPSGKIRMSQYREIRKSVCLRFEEERKKAGLLGRIRLWFRIERETEAELKKKFPPGAMYGICPVK